MPIPPSHWVRAADRAGVRPGDPLVVKLGAKQILLLETPEGLFACNNRCPHEGFPLSEGTLSPGATLTCNWHNWKFKLDTGETLVGGDCLRRYPVETRDGAVWIDIADPPAEDQEAKALENLKQAFDDYDYTRIAREIARLDRPRGNGLEAIRQAIHWTHDKLEYGMVHGYGGAAEWLELRALPGLSETERLIPLVEICTHIAWDSLRQPAFPYPDGQTDYDADALVDAIIREDEPAAAARIRGAYAAGLTYQDLRPALARAALAHYADFGHCAIYTVNAGKLIEKLGDSIDLPLTLALVRQQIFARREDLLPEFRGYDKALKDWTSDGQEPVTAEDFIGLGVNDALARALRSSGRTEDLYHALLGAAAWSMLHLDLAFDRHTDKSVSNNVSWLDVTHMVTFANAIRHLCTESPDLWPQALLQMALFTGRNARFMDRSLDEARWAVPDRETFWRDSIGRLFDHGEFRHIIAVHYVKTLMAVRDELPALKDEALGGRLMAALNRFLNEPIRGRHVRRTAHQALTFVAGEG